MLIKLEVNAKLYASGIDLQSGRIKFQLIKDEAFMPTKSNIRSVTFQVRIFQRNVLEQFPGRQQMFQRFTVFDPVITSENLSYVNTSMTYAQSFFFF